MKLELLAGSMEVDRDAKPFGKIGGYKAGHGSMYVFPESIACRGR